MHRGLLDDVVHVVQRTGDPATDSSLSVAALLLGPIVALAFWLSVGLPLAYVPLFVAGVVDGVTAAQLVVGHAVAVVVGHSHGR